MPRRRRDGATLGRLTPNQRRQRRHRSKSNSNSNSFPVLLKAQKKRQESPESWKRRLQQMRDSVSGQQKSPGIRSSRRQSNTGATAATTEIEALGTSCRRLQKGYKLQESAKPAVEDSAAFTTSTSLMTPTSLTQLEETVPQDCANRIKQAENNMELSNSLANTKLVDDDDDVVILSDDEAQSVFTKASQTSSQMRRGESQQALQTTEATIENVTKAIQEAKMLSCSAELDLAGLAKEKNRRKSCLTDSVYASIKFLLSQPKYRLTIPVTWPELEKLIFRMLNSLTAEEQGDLSNEEYEMWKQRLDAIEKANQVVSKTFLECHTKLKELKRNLLLESAELDKKIEMSESCMLIESDEEDDVTIIGSSSSGQGQPSKQLPHEALVPPRPPPTSMQQQQQQQMPPISQLRSEFASVISQSMPTLLSSLQSQQNYQHQRQVHHPPVVRTPSSLPPFKWPEIQVADKVLGKKFNDVWYSGTVIDIYSPTVSENHQWQYKIKFDGKGMKMLPGKHIAYREPINRLIRVGTRVVALYKEDDAPNSFFAGVIAEAPSVKNNKRFLVFFDDGYAQYCDAKELHKVYMQSQNVWEDINPETSSFIKEYLRIYPERPMVRLSKGQVVRTEWNGKWWTAKVQETDASLVKMYFQADKRTEWIYRGSTRLEPLFKALANANAIKEAGSSKGRRHNLTMRPSDMAKKPSVEYTRGISEDDTVSGSGPTASKAAAGTAVQPTPPSKPPETKKRPNIAKKSTGGGTSATSKDIPGSITWEAPWIKYQRKATPGQLNAATTRADSEVQRQLKEKLQGSTSKSSKDLKDIASVLQERLASSNSQVEYDEEKATGERKEIVIETPAGSKKPFQPHACGLSCLIADDNPEEFKGRSSLTIPLLCGWERQVCKTRPTAKRFVVYRAPCGRRIRNIEEMDKYLMITNSNLTIDLFCFDHQLHISTEFVPVKTFCDIKDMSYGKENYPVSCVNGMDREYPDLTEYSDFRIPSDGVNLNTDPDFLVCCDCTDNCRDRSKCACQQMTIENTSWIGEIDSDAGYHYRHLREPLFTGIVECNSQCHCDKRCHNRVAQLGLRMRLQVFKTDKKGWGLRCLDDIAKGSFICIYAGQLLTDRVANVGGKQFGDEYLAELDFIEVVERQKEGYESDADMDFSDDDDANYKASKDSEEDSDYAGYQPVEGERRRTRRTRGAKLENVESTKKDNVAKKDETPLPQTTVDDAISISDDDDDEEMETQTSTVSKVNSAQTAEKKESAESTKVPESETNKTVRKPRAKKSTGGSRFNLSTSLNPCQEPLPEKGEKTEKKERVSTRSYFNDDTECYIMDAKLKGNLGRYLNHSCSPNVFVQNIFVDTHDLRFPWVAFFAGQYIRAGTELTWDYNYEVGSVSDKVLYCYCGSSSCRGRLL